MFRIVVYACVVQAVVCIIVTDAPPTSTEYNYWYNIVDPSTGDTKSAQEIRHGNIVKGSYSVVDPDGIKRTVDYTAGGSHGFKAVVRNEPITNILNQRSKQQPYYSSVPVQSYESYGYPAPVKQVKIPVLSNKKFVKSPVYFTPGNDTSSERGNFKQGEFFKPNYMHK